MAISKVYPSIGPSALEIDGQFVCWVSSATGGGPRAEVIETPVAGAPTDKSIGRLTYEDMVVTCGIPQGLLADWLTEFLDGQAPQRDGAIVFLDRNYQQSYRLAWTDGSITALTLPKLDGASPGQPVRFTIAIRSPDVRRVAGAGKALPAPQLSAKKTQASNFSVDISGVNSTLVRAVEALTIGQEYFTPATGRRKAEPGPLRVDDLVLSVSESGGADFLVWSDAFLVRGNNGAAQEKTATIKYLGPDLRTVWYSINLHGVGIRALAKEAESDGSLINSSLRATAYVERVELGSPTTSPVPNTESPISGGNDLRDVLGKRLQAADVARRLRATADQGAPESTGRQRQLGFDIGVAWAQRRASLEELREVASIDEHEWSAIGLPEGHSLADTLAATGDIPLQYDGQLVLARDALSEGVLAGILQAMSEVSQEITQNLK